MSLSLHCGCGNRFVVLDVAAGTTVRCSRCQASLAVPALPVREEPVADGDDVGAEGDKTAYAMRDLGQTGTDLGVAAHLGHVRLTGDTVDCLAYGADHVTAVAGGDNDVFFLDLTARNSVRGQGMHHGTIRCVSLSPDCRLALSGDQSGGLLLWDVAGKRPLRWLDGHRGEIKTVTFSPDGKWAASGGAGGAVRLWEIPSGEMLALDRGQLEQAVNCLCFSPDSRKLAAIGEFGRARLWSVALRETVGKLEKGADNLHSAAFSKDGTYVVASKEEGFKVVKWNVETGERQRCFAGSDERLHRGQRTWVTPDGRCVLSLNRVTNYGHRNRALILSPWLALGGVIGGGLMHATVGDQADRLANELLRGGLYSLELWDLTQEKAIGSVEIGPRPSCALASSADGRRILVGFDGGIVALFGL
jgi:WD40 repeat protein